MADQPTPQPSTGPLSTEPVITLTAIYGVVGALLALLIAFGINIDPDKRDAILGVIGVVFPIVAALHIRSIVFSPHTVNKIEQVG